MKAFIEKIFTLPVMLTIAGFMWFTVAALVSWDVIEVTKWGYVWDITLVSIIMFVLAKNFAINDELIESGDELEYLQSLQIDLLKELNRRQAKRIEELESVVGNGV